MNLSAHEADAFNAPEWALQEVKMSNSSSIRFREDSHVSPGDAQAGTNWVPALDPRDSISADGNTIYCLVDGVPLKMLKRYIKRWGFTPDSYRQVFGLPGNYPMTAPGYAAAKNEEAKRIGLGAP